MARGEVLIKARTRGARRAGHRISAMGRRVQPALMSEFRGPLAAILESQMKRFAPRGKKPRSVKPGPRLRETINVRVHSRGGWITATARSEAVDPFSRYHYTGVTRFGHRTAIIRPKAGRRFLVFWAPHAGREVAVRFVRGYRPAGDWASRAFVAVDRAAAQSAERIGRRIVIGA